MQWSKTRSPLCDKKSANPTSIHWGRSVLIMLSQQNYPWSVEVEQHKFPREVPPPGYWAVSNIFNTFFSLAVQVEYLIIPIQSSTFAVEISSLDILMKRITSTVEHSFRLDRDSSLFLDNDRAYANGYDRSRSNDDISEDEYICLLFYSSERFISVYHLVI